MDLSFYAVGKSGYFMGFDDLIGSGISPFRQIFLPVEDPSFTHGTVEEAGSALFVAEVGEGMRMADEFTAGSDFLNQINGKGFVGNLDAFDDFADHGVNFIIDDEFSKVESDTEVEHTGTVNQVSATLGSQQRGEGLFVSGLSIGNFGVCLPTGYKAGKVVELRQSGNRGGNHTEFGSADGSGGVTHIHDRSGTGINAGSAFLYQLA